MTPSLSGGGKRAKQDKSETILTKDEKIKTNSFETDKNLYILSTMTANPIVPEILNNINKLDQAVSLKGAMKEMSKLLSSEILDNLLTSLRSHKESSRIQGLVNAIFAQDLQNITASKQILDTSENTLLLCRRADRHQGVLRQEVRLEEGRGEGGHQACRSI